MIASSSYFTFYFFIRNILFRVDFEFYDSQMNQMLYEHGLSSKELDSEFPEEITTPKHMFVLDSSSGLLSHLLPCHQGTVP